MTDHIVAEVAEEKKLSDYGFVKEKRQVLPYDFVKKYCLLPIDEEDGKLIVATSDPNSFEALEEVRLLFD